MNEGDQKPQEDIGVATSGFDSMLPVGTALHEFEIVGVVGKGGFSFVYLATDHSLQRTVALKEYMPAALAMRLPDDSIRVRAEKDRGTFEVGLRSFVNEARLLAKFEHPALLKVYRFWEGNGTAYMAMPYYQGTTLKELVRSTPGAITEHWLKEFLAPITDALEVLHGAQCYHRDISPDNIQLLRNGMPLLLDFGAARRIIADMTQAITVILKPGYAPVEQYSDDASVPQGPWTDIYALAAVVYFCITGKPPVASVARTLKDSLPPLQSLVGDRYTAEFLRAIERGLAVLPASRPQSMAEFRSLLQLPLYRSTAASTGLSTPSPGHPPVPPLVDMRPTAPGTRRTNFGSSESGPQDRNKRGSAVWAPSSVVLDQSKSEHSAGDQTIAMPKPAPLNEERQTETRGHARPSHARGIVGIGFVAASLIVLGYLWHASSSKQATSITSVPSKTTASNPAVPPANIPQETNSRVDRESSQQAGSATQGEMVTTPTQDKAEEAARAKEEAKRARETQTAKDAKRIEEAKRNQEAQRAQEAKRLADAKRTAEVKPPVRSERAPSPASENVRLPDQASLVPAPQSGPRDQQIASLRLANLGRDSEIRIRENMIRQLQAGVATDNIDDERGRLVRREREQQIEIARAEIALLRHERSRDAAIRERLDDGRSEELPDRERRDAEGKALQQQVIRMRDGLDRLQTRRTEAPR